jgi:trehalose/maltose transport system substrate-binding protein
MATAIQTGERNDGNADFWGFVWQGNAYEGLTCNALEWIASSRGGTIVSDSGVVTVDNPAAVAALDQAVGWVGSITPSDVTTYAEEDARTLFQSGNAAFMRNWPYAYDLLQGAGSAVRGQIGIAPLPSSADGESAGTLGGRLLGVPDTTPYPETATDLVRFLTSDEAQKALALDLGYWPTRPALYDDADVLAAQPAAEVIGNAADTAVSRPSTVTGADYDDVSNTFFSAVHDALTGAVTAADALQQASIDIQTLTGFPSGSP